MQHDVSTTIGLFAVVNLEGGRTIAGPFYALRIIAIATSDDVNAVSHHKGWVEAKTEVADDSRSVVFVLLKEIVSAREGNLVDVFVNLFSGHTDTTIADSECLGLLVNRYVYSQIAQLALEIALHG